MEYGFKVRMEYGFKVRMEYGFKTRMEYGFKIRIDQVSFPLMNKQCGSIVEVPQIIHTYIQRRTLTACSPDMFLQIYTSLLISFSCDGNTMLTVSTCSFT